MKPEIKLYNYLKLRRRIDRKILLNQKWSAKYTWQNKVEIFLMSKNISSFWCNERQWYFLLNKKIKDFAIKNLLIDTAPGLTIESINSCKIIPIWFNDLKSFDKQLQEHGAKLIIQGSFADSEFTNYSDVDLIIFYEPYSKDVLEIKKQIEIFLLHIDPLQHHGIFMIDINTFDFYWQMDLPLNALKKAKCFSDGSYHLKIVGLLKENVSSSVAVENIISIIKNLLLKNYSTIGLWEWKFFISQLLLLPALLSGSKGNYVYKKDSFQLIDEMYSVDARYCIDKASEIRNAWPGNTSLEIYNKLRNSVSEKPKEDPIKAVDYKSISTANNSQFTTSLRALVSETQHLISI